MMQQQAAAALLMRLDDAQRLDDAHAAAYVTPYPAI
jgi:hypothetical protein